MPRAVDLRRVAEWTGTSIDDIQALNPELRRWTTPIKYPEFQLKVPPGTGPVLQSHLAEASPADFTALKWHTVRRGETLLSIARKLKVSRVDLAEANSLSTRSRVRAGQELIIPRPPALLLATNTERAVPAEVASRSLSGTATVPSPARSGPRIITYQVKRGDTLSRIARLFNTTVAEITSWNKLRSSALSIGARLKIHQ